MYTTCMIARHALKCQYCNGFVTTCHRFCALGHTKGKKKCTKPREITGNHSGREPARVCRVVGERVQGREKEAQYMSDTEMKCIFSRVMEQDDSLNGQGIVEKRRRLRAAMEELIEEVERKYFEWGYRFCLERDEESSHS